MISNKELSRAFRLASQLMELHDENPFKIRSMQNAAFKIERHPDQLTSLPEGELAGVEGIGKSTAAKIRQLTQEGTFDELDTLVASTPAGVIDMLAIKGIGPKKVRSLWKELGIESVGELLYACNENRLIELKGFGKKTQEQVRQSIEYARSNEGKYHYATVESEATKIVNDIQEAFPGIRIEFTGALRRKSEVLETGELIVVDTTWTRLVEKFSEMPSVQGESIEPNAHTLRFLSGQGIPFVLNACSESEFEKQLFLTTGSAEHMGWLNEHAPGLEVKGNTETEIYTNLGLPYIEPEFREGLFEKTWLQKGRLPVPVNYTDLKGTLHNHTTYSDGIHSLEEMAAYSKSMGFQYLGVCDHSRSAFYANGLQPDRVLLQQEEIDKLNERLGPFRIFKGIESDILVDGSLDYDEDILSTFDFIVASVHSVLRMDKEKATARLIKAVEHPRTTILGHPTGRLLLAREGYPVDMRKVIDACAANGVVMELNANPYRLDMDWRHIPYALEKGVMISINPDAHHREGIHDMHYGVCAARKGGLPAECTFNALDLQSVDEWFRKKSG